MSLDRRGLLYNGTGQGPEARQQGGFNLQELPIILHSHGLTGPVTIQYLQPDTGVWFDVMVNAAPLQLTPDNTFAYVTIQGSYRIKPGEATGSAVIAFSEVNSVPEWDWGCSGVGAGGGSSAPQLLSMTPDGVLSLSGGGGSVDAASILLPIELSNVDGSKIFSVGK